MVSRSCFVIGRWHDEMFQFYFEIVLLNVDPTTLQPTEQQIVMVPGVACVAVISEPGMRHEVEFYVIQANGVIMKSFKGNPNSPAKIGHW